MKSAFILSLFVAGSSAAGVRGITQHVITAEDIKNVASQDLVGLQNIAESLNIGKADENRLLQEIEGMTVGEVEAAVQQMLLSDPMNDIPEYEVGVHFALN